MIFDVELNCDKWKDCKTKWCNGDGGFWCKEDCKPITPKKNKVEKVLSNSDADDYNGLNNHPLFRRPGSIGGEQE